MGQYFKGAILKINHKLAKQPVLFSLRPSEYDNLSKLMEHSYIGNRYVGAYMEMISDTDGIYFGYPFVWIGDYADKVKEKNYYDYACNICDKFKGHSEKVTGSKYYQFLVNFSKKEFIIMPHYDNQKWQVHPLSLLTASGNSRGNGDYYGEDKENVGRWAFDKIGATNDSRYIAGMKLITLKFKSPF